MKFAAFSLLCWLAASALLSSQASGSPVQSDENHELEPQDLERISDHLNRESDAELLHEVAPSGNSASISRLLHWDEYKKRYHKHYRSLSEQLFRLRQFIAHLLRVAASKIAFRSKKSSYHLELNQFSDRTREELREFAEAPDAEAIARTRPTQSHKLVKRGADFFGKLVDAFKSAATKKGDQDELTIDWRSSGCLQRVPANQGDCGSCYAMASIKLYEFLYCTQMRRQPSGENQSPSAEFVKFSEQIIVDCGKPYGLSGCEQGNPKAVTRFVESVGLIPSDKYAYVDGEQECPLESDPKIANETRAIRPARTEMKVLKLAEWSAALRRRPLLVFMFFHDDLYEFAGGLFTYRADGAKSVQCDRSAGHYMVLVGEGKRSDGAEFWLMQNSFGPDWADAGHLKLDKSGDDCVGYVLELDAEFTREI